jgi:hypothetical protein
MLGTYNSDDTGPDASQDDRLLFGMTVQPMGADDGTGSFTDDDGTQFGAPPAALSCCGEASKCTACGC